MNVFNICLSQRLAVIFASYKNLLIAELATIYTVRLVSKTVMWRIFYLLYICITVMVFHVSKARSQ